jgi:hypothetical protein
MKAEHILPDGINQVDLGGATIRKGTVGAFLFNARVWCDTNSSDSARAEAAADIVDALPALRAIGLFDALEIRDTALRGWIDSLRPDDPAADATGFSKTPS